MRAALALVRRIAGAARRRPALWRLAVALSGAALLAACAGSPQAPRSTAPPMARPAGLAPAPAPATQPAGPSAESQALRAYYSRIQSDNLVQGLMRTDGGGPDTVFTDTMLVRNFARIALEEEYARGAGLRPSTGGASAIKKWVQPVRVTAEFGASVGRDQRVTDANMLGAYVRRLARISGHPIRMDDAQPNFHVLFMGADDMDRVAPRIRALVPDASPRALALFDSLPRSVHCLVMAFSDEPGGYRYGRAIAVIRAEHPDLMRQSCIHEEVAQGLGLANDHPQARPSIFNDDDEFALLTTHDAMLLELLYDPALEPGMTAEQALPIVRRQAAAMMDSSG